MTAIYHITHVSNLAPIIAAGGLHCVEELRKSGTGKYLNIAYPHIQDRRASRRVPCGPKGTLADYVPFYFAPRSPMLFTISKGNVPNYTEGQEPIVHLVVEAEEVAKKRLGFVFTDGHAVIEFSRFFVSLNNLDRIDWNLMRARYWYDTLQDGDRKRRRQAEFLVHRFVPWTLVRGIGVMNETTKGRVEHAIRQTKHQPMVSVERAWYY